METNHSKRKQRFFVKSIVETTSRSKKMVVDNKEVSIEEYFKNQYQITLKYPNVPLVETSGRDGSRYYPMEMCYVCDNQRVKTEQQTPLMTQKTIKVINY